MLNAMINAALAAVNPTAWQTNENGEGSTAGRGDGMGDGMNGMGDNDREQMNTMIEAECSRIRF